MAGFLDRIRSKFVKQNHRKNMTERLKKRVESKDYLLNQIDEFREKAQQLQELLINKESKVNELQDIVDEKTEQADELEQVLKERQGKADEISVEFGKQIDAMTAKVSEKMETIQKLSNENQEKNKAMLVEAVDSLKKELENFKAILESNKEETKQILEDENKALTAALDAAKNEINEKVHSENVSCYRNIQGLAKEYEEKFEKIVLIENNTKEIRGFAKFTTIISVLNFLFLVAFILYSLGVFSFI